MGVAVEAEDLAKAAQLGQDLRAVQGPLLPGAKDRVQGGVGQDNQGGFGVQALQLPGQPAAAGVAHPEKWAAGAGAPGGVDPQHLQARQAPGKPRLPETAAPGRAAIRPDVAFAQDHEEGRRQVGENFLPEGQGGGVAAMGQIAGEQDQIGGGFEAAQLRHRPGQGLRLGAAQSPSSR